MQDSLFDASRYDNLEADEENTAHFNVLLRAGAIYEERTLLRGQHWKTAPLSRHIDNIDTKVGRLKMIAELGRSPVKADLDEALDIINYGVFCVREIERQLDVLG